MEAPRCGALRVLRFSDPQWPTVTTFDLSQLKTEEQLIVSGV
jgi:hypothetical protein